MALELTLQLDRLGGLRLGPLGNAQGLAIGAKDAGGVHHASGSGIERSSS